MNSVVEEKRRKLRRASPRTTVRKEDLLPIWSWEELDACVVFSIDDLQNEAQLWGPLERNKRIACIGI